MISKNVFNVIAKWLYSISRKTGRSYHEINIILYFFIIPFSWFVLFDKITGTFYFGLGFLIFTIGFFVGCQDFKGYSEWLFSKSVSFLNFFNKFGSNYIRSSVIICVLIPLMVYGFLIYFLN